MASIPTTFAEFRDRHEQNLIDALRDLKAAKKYDIAAISPDETRVARGMHGIADILSALRGHRVMGEPEMVFNADRGFFPKDEG